MAEPRRVYVHTPEGHAGSLWREGDTYFFHCDPAAVTGAAPSLAMPLRARPYEHPRLHPVFQMNLPEGYVLEQLRRRLAKVTGLDPLLLLTLVGGEAPIGRLRFSSSPEPSPADAIAAPQGERLAELLAAPGTHQVFAQLVDRYLLRSGLSGVQPKVLVPEARDVQAATEAPVPFKAAAVTQDLIVKSGLDEFPGLALNEFVCMSIVQRAGLPVPEFHLSQDGELFIMRRFDRPADGRVLGFEDLLVLAGRAPEHKYSGSYELAMKLLRLYVSPEHLPQARQQLFDMVTLSCLLGNGDAHLKNFGVLYDTLDSPVRMAPAYDIVCTRHYLPDDTLALDLAGHRSFFAARQGILDFGHSCDLTRSAVVRRVRQLTEGVLESLEALEGTLARLPGLKKTIQDEALLWRKTFARL